MPPEGSGAVGEIHDAVQEEISQILALGKKRNLISGSGFPEEYHQAMCFFRRRRFFSGFPASPELPASPRPGLCSLKC